LASAITHFIVGACVALPAMESAGLCSAMPGWAIPATAGFFAVAPDFDTFLGIPHRGVTHSLAFLVVLTAAAAFLAARGRTALVLAAVWGAAAITHPLLDMLTDGGRGVMLFFPFFDERLFFPWRPIRVSPLGILRFFPRAGEILKSEAPFDAAALLAGVVARGACRRPRS
jgi:inner membrane protein